MKYYQEEGKVNQNHTLSQKDGTNIADFPTESSFGSWGQMNFEAYLFALVSFLPQYFTQSHQPKFSMFSTWLGDLRDDGRYSESIVKPLLLVKEYWQDEQTFSYSFWHFLKLKRYVFYSV